MEKNNIEKLKTLADNIQSAKLGKRGKEIHVNSHTVIDEYQEWRTETEDLFDNYFDKSNSQYKKFKELPIEGNGYTLINYFEIQYPIFKLLIKKIESGEAMKQPKKSTKAITTKRTNGKTVFVSHATKDKEIIDAFVDIILVGGLSVPIDEIFCVSTDGTKIKSGADWRNSINESLLSAKINFLIITPNYKESEVCLNEMGAAWVTDAEILPLIVEPINYKTVGVIQEPTQIEKLLDEKSLDRIRDIVQEKLEIPTTKIKSDRWTAKKIEFLHTVKKYLENASFQIPMDRDAFNGLIKEKGALEKTVTNLIKEKEELKTLVNELKKAKDKDEVAVVLKKRNPSTQFKDFQELCKTVKQKLIQNDAIINGIIFKSYSGKELTIKWQNNKDKIDEALANDFIDEDLNVKWEATREMKEIKGALAELATFLAKNLKDEFHDSFEEHFDAPIDINNKKFWEEVLKIPISFN
jgi:hypothetical protein